MFYVGLTGFDPLSLRSAGQSYFCSISSGGAPEPVLEARRTEARVVAGGETLIVHRRPEVTCVCVRGHRPPVSVCTQKSPDEFVETDRFGTRQFHRAVQRVLDRGLRHNGGDVIRREWLHQCWRQPNRLPI